MLGRLLLLGAIVTAGAARGQPATPAAALPVSSETKVFALDNELGQVLLWSADRKPVIHVQKLEPHAVWFGWVQMDCLTETRGGPPFHAEFTYMVDDNPDRTRTGGGTDIATLVSVSDRVAQSLVGADLEVGTRTGRLKVFVNRPYTHPFCVVKASEPLRFEESRETAGPDYQRRVSRFRTPLTGFRWGP